MDENISIRARSNRQLPLKFDEGRYGEIKIRTENRAGTLRILCERDEDGYTAPHNNKTDSERHSTSRGDDHTTHNYDDGSGRHDPFPIGGNDKWISNDKKD